MAMCRYCNKVRRKAKGDSWDKMMCSDCWRVTGHYSWSARWDLAGYVKLNKFDLNITR